MNRVISASIIIIICFSFCNKEKQPPIGTSNKIVIETLVVNGIHSDSASSGGDVKSDGGETILERGICWATKTKPTMLDSNIRVSGTIGLFNASLKNLIPNRQYYVRAFAKNKHDIVYGEEEGFKTATSTALVNTLSVSSIGQTTAVVNGSVTNDGGSVVTQRGFCWSTSPLPTTANNVVNSGSGIGNFSASLSGLTPGGNYYVRAFAINSRGTAYGNQLSFTTQPTSLPLLTTSTVTSITNTSALSGGSITSDGGAMITQRGVCWNTSASPTIANNRTLNGTGIGTFSSSLSGLTYNTTYFVRAYATNTAGTAYGNQYSFSTTGYTVGNIGPAGGLIFYDKGVFSNGWRYLEAAPVDQTSAAQWGCSGTNITDANVTGIGVGQSNTTAIITSCSTIGIAARLCDQLVINGYLNWFLPSYNELHLMYQNLKSYGLGSFSNSFYWSSNQYSSTNASAEDFSIGTIYSVSKSSNYRVRAIRAF
jgi:hypothetical protein